MAQALLLVALALPLGLHVDPYGLVLLLGLLALLAFGLASLSYVLALHMPSQDTFAPIVNSTAPNGVRDPRSCGDGRTLQHCSARFDPRCGYCA